MMYVRDEVVDKIVERDEELQAVVQGRKVMLWRPGQSVGLAVQASLLLGWTGISLSLFWLSVPSVETLAYYIVGALIVAAPINVLNYRMIRGWKAARTHIYRFSVFLVIVAIVALALCVLKPNRVASAMAAAGLAFSVLAMQLIASRSYALLSAGFRAQRKYLAK